MVVRLRGVRDAFRGVPVRRLGRPHQVRNLYQHHGEEAALRERVRLEVAEPADGPSRQKSVDPSFMGRASGAADVLKRLIVFYLFRVFAFRFFARLFLFLLVLVFFFFLVCVCFFVAERAGWAPYSVNGSLLRCRPLGTPNTCGYVYRAHVFFYRVPAEEYHARN